MYLSSYKLGNESDKLREMVPENKKLACIFNALDSDIISPDRRREHVVEGTLLIAEVGFQPEELDLRDYFGKTESLKEKIKEYGGVWVRGGNVFVLRQAMKLSGFDVILQELEKDEDFFYGGYSAGICILGPTLDSIQLVDDMSQLPYLELQEVLWDGLNILDYLFLPHYDSNHPESQDIEKAVEYCKKHDIRYRTIKDGEVVIVN